MSKTKYIFVTGGVLSGLGKGVSAASLGRLLSAKGFKVFAQKFDPYYNPDPGTMSPYQHGEVYVTVDGGETDLDLGHYERFINQDFKKVSNVTQGRLLWDLLNEERAGKFDGETVQVVPHVTDKIIAKLEEAAKVSKADFIIAEVGGTVGDIESLPFMYALAQFARKNRNDCFFMHATFIPYLESSEEFKSKPTQQSLSQLQSLGIFPDMLLLRANRDLGEDVVAKIAEKSMIEKEYCIPVPNVSNIYKVPILFNKFKMAELVLKKLGIKDRKTDMKDWNDFVALIDAPKTKSIKLGLVGKYVEYEDAYKSISEALRIAAIYEKTALEIKWVQADKLTESNITSSLKGVDGVVILPGFGERGFNGKVVAAKYVRDNKIPTLGICYGFQAMVVDQAKRMGIEDATSSEVSKEGSFVIDILPGKNTQDRGGTLRLGASKTLFAKGSKSEKLYGADFAIERHRHRYETSPKFVEKIEDKNFKFTGYDATTKLAEVCELKNHPFYIGVQAHPEFNARPLNNHPLFRGLVKATLKNKKA